MKKIFCIASLFFAISLTAQNNLAKDIAFGKYEAKKPSQIVAMTGGEFYAQLSQDGKKISQISFKTGKEEKVLFDATYTRNKTVKSIEGFSICPMGKKMLVYTNSEKVYDTSFAADYFVFDIQRNRLDLLSDSIGKQRDPIFSPDGENIVFARGNHLFLKKLAYQTETQVSRPDEFRVNGITDWLYENTFGKTNLIVWSPDNKRIAYIGLDEKDIPSSEFTTYGTNIYPQTSTVTYPKAGGENPKPTLYIFDVYYKSTQKVDLPETDFYIPHIQWTNDIENLAVFALNRNQNQLKMYSVNTKSLVPKVILTEKLNDYFDAKIFDFLYFLKDGKFSFAAQKDGVCRLSLYNANGIVAEALTDVKYDVTGFYGYDTIKKLFYIQAAGNTPAGREIYSVTQSGNIDKISNHKEGVTCAYFGGNYNYFVQKYATANAAPVYSVCSNSGKEISVLENNEDLTKTVAALPKKEFTTLHNQSAWIVKPANFSENTKYPVVILKSCVKDCFKIGLEHLLAANGIIVIGIDSKNWDNASADLLAVAKEVSSLPYINKEKIGVYGKGFAASMALNAMSAGENVFAAGVAIAPVTNYRLASSAGVERYFQRPQENVRSYNNSPVNAAGNLNGKLLLIHGTADKEVQIQQTFVYTNALVAANKQFDMQIYPDQGNFDAQTQAHAFERILNFFVENLK